MQQGQADMFLFHGKVVREDGSPPGFKVAIERSCYAMENRLEVVSDKNGQYIWHVETAPYSPITMGKCVLVAMVKGYSSTTIDLTDPRLSSNPQLPTIVIAPIGSDPTLAVPVESVPHRAQQAWDAGLKALQQNQLYEAERQLSAAVEAAPKFAPAWSALAIAFAGEQKSAEARQAFEKAIALDPKDPLPYFRLTRLYMDDKDWQSAAKAADDLMRVDTRHRYLNVLVDNAIIRFHLNDLDRAEESVKAAIRLDKGRRFPRAEYVLGMILEARKDFASAGEHMHRYLELDPKAPDQAAVLTRLQNLGKPESSPVTAELDAVPNNPPVGEEAWVPGGLQAFAAIAHIDKTLSHANFFLEYARAVTRESAPANPDPIPDYAATIKTYISAVSELARLGEQKGDSTVVTIAFTTDLQRKNADRILAILGWKAVEQGGSLTIEPGDHPTDVLHQPIPAALGIDEITMQETLETKRIFSFEIQSGSAHLDNAGAWSEYLKSAPPMPGGIAELLARDARTARAYASLGSMENGASEAVLKSIGLKQLVTQDSSTLWLYSQAFAVAKGTAVLPGGPNAHAAWQRLAGASPYDPPAFFRGLIEKDHGSLAAFYYAVSRGDAAHQRFFTKTGERAERFYTWYRRSSDLSMAMDRIMGSWRVSLFCELPLDAEGNVRYPGGVHAWAGATDGEDGSVLGLDAIQALLAIAQLEEKRKAPLDRPSAALLASHYGEWQSLFPYFESLPGLGREEFQALAAFSETVARSKTAARNTLMAEWHSLVDLIVLGTKSGTLDAAQSAAAFRHVSEGLAGDDHSAKALGLLLDTVVLAASKGDAGSTPSQLDLDEAVPSSLLRLNGARREAFDRVKALQQVPRLDSLTASPNSGRTAAALTGLVYAAELDPRHLLVAEDPNLLRKHVFLPDDSRRLFAAPALVTSSEQPGSALHGGFAGFDDVVKRLAKGAQSAGPHAAFSTAVNDVTAAGPAPTDSSGSAPAEAPSETVFRATGRLVEVYATVKDEHNRYVDDLPASEFTISEEGNALETVAFETRVAPVSVALLFDTTGSMQAALPALRNAALKLIGELRPIDSVAIYTFNDSVTEFQPFTTDKSALKRAVMRTHAGGSTALYDALVRVNLGLTGRSGKKVIVVFTDGSDNCSVLTTDAAILRAKSAGIPIYTIAQGSALSHPELLKQLSTVSKTTGGVSFVIREPSEIRSVFEAVSQDLLHGYLITFQPPSAEGHTWHPIDVRVAGPKNRKVRAREGYFPE